MQLQKPNFEENYLELELDVFCTTRNLVPGSKQGGSLNAVRQYRKPPWDVFRRRFSRKQGGCDITHNENGGFGNISSRSFTTHRSAITVTVQLHPSPLSRKSEKQLINGTPSKGVR